MSLCLKNAGRNFGSQWAVRNVDLTVGSGTALAVLGPNGAGKSTLLRLMAGWIPCSEGRISIDNRLMRTGSVSVRRELMLLDEPVANDSSVIESIGQAISDYRVDRPGIEGEVAQWFEKLDLVGVYGKSTQAVSKGQRYKIAMISLFLVRPHIWLLDEPFSAGLDAAGLQYLETQMRAHVNTGGIVVFSSQWPEHANRLATETLVLHEGNVVCQQTIEQPIPAVLIQSSSPSLTAVLQGLGNG